MKIAEALAALFSRSENLMKNPELQRDAFAKRKVRNWRDLLFDKDPQHASRENTNALTRISSASPYRSLWRFYHD